MEQPSGERDAAARALSRGVERGESDAVAALYQAWFPRVLAIARRHVGSHDDLCLDAVQETFVRAITSMPTLGSSRALEAWMCRAARSASIDLRRRRSRGLERDRRAARDGARDGAHAGAVEPGERAALDDESARAAEALASLAQADWAITRARVESDRTLGEIAESNGLAGPHAAHGRIRRALARLRAMLEEPDGA